MAGHTDRVLYFDLDGTLIHSGFGSVKPRLESGGFERAVRAAGFTRLVCVGNAVAIVHALAEEGREPDGLGIILALTFGAISDEAWFRRVTTLVPDPRHRAAFIDHEADWWWVDDLAERYLALEKMAERYAAHAGERIFAPDPEGEGQDILDWLARVPRVGPRPHEPRHEPG